MSSRRRGPFAALAAPVLLTMVALGSLLTGVHASPAAADTPAANELVKVTVHTLTPIAPQPGDSLTISGRLVNVSQETISDLYVKILVDTKLQSRSDFQSYADDQSADLPSYYPTPAATPADPSELAPGESEPYSLTIDDVSTLNLPEADEVYPMAVGVTGQTQSGYGTVGQLHTFLPWWPDDKAAVPNTSLAWVVPLIDRPHRNADGTWFDDDLAPELAPGGRLSKILNAGVTAANQRPFGPNTTTSNVTLTWAIDPMLLSDLESMSAGYQVAQTSVKDGKVVTTTVPGKGQQLAKAWLTRLQAVVKRPGAEVIALPFGDPDVVAAVRAKLTNEVSLLITTGRSKVAAALPGARVEPVAWPPGGQTNPHTADILAAGGNTSMILDPQALPALDGPPDETPSARTQFSTPSGDVKLNGLLTDEGLNADIVDGASNPFGLRASVQEFAAETLMIHAERPADERSLVVTPNRHWNPPPTYAASLLEATGKLPWLQSANISTVAASPVWTAVDRGPLQYPANARAKELPPDYTGGVAALGDDIATFRAILPQNSNVTAGYQVAQSEALSTAWRNDPVQANERLFTLQHSLKMQMSQVRISTNAKSYVTLTSHGGRIPITVANDLPENVTVKVRLLPNARLSGSSESTVQILAGQQKLVQLHATARTSGDFPVRVQLETLQGELYNDTSVQLFVRSTDYGTITLLITGAATAALMVAVVIRLTRRGLRARRSGGEPA